jgi:hypothetical protein
MSDTLEFPSVVLKSFSRNRTGGDASFMSTFPASVGKAMGWNGIPQGVTSAKLEGQLAATHVQLKPKDGELKKWKIDFDATNVADFQVFRLELEGHKGKGHRIELRFKVSFADTKACAELEKYLTSVGEAKSTLTVSYVQQAELPMEDVAGDERRQATMADND